MQWNHRKEKLISEILRSEADIVCLQEVDHFFDFFLPRLKENGFKGFFNPKKPSPCIEVEGNSGPDGCALFYKTTKFVCLDKQELTLRNADGEKASQVAILVKLGRREMTSGNEYEAASGEISATPQTQFCVAVTHLKAREHLKHVRLTQGSYLYSEMREFSDDSPAVICGDFNAQATEPMYEYFKRGSWLSSSYSICYGGKEPPFTSWKFRPGKEAKYVTVDYIWCTSELLQVKAVWGIPSEEEIGENALPGLSYPSDHIALCAQFKFMK